MLPGNKTTRLLVATSNLKKLKELHELLAGLPVELLSLKDIPGISEVEETGSTFEENAVLKARGYAAQTGLLTMGEDSGICCDALNGDPGVFSARYAGAGKNDDDNNAKLLEVMKHVPEEQRTAYYESAIALAESGKLIGVVKGQVHGVIANELHGTGGFGYDPLFYYPPYQKTFGQVSSEMKHKVSHRGKALEEFRKLLAFYFDGLAR